MDFAARTRSVLTHTFRRGNRISARAYTRHDSSQLRCFASLPFARCLRQRLRRHRHRCRGDAEHVQVADREHRAWTVLKSGVQAMRTTGTSGALGMGQAYEITFTAGKNQKIQLRIDVWRVERLVLRARRRRHRALRLERHADSGDVTQPVSRSTTRAPRSTRSPASATRSAPTSRSPTLARPIRTRTSASSARRHATDGSHVHVPDDRRV